MRYYQNSQSYSIDDKIEYLKNISNEDLKVLSDWSNKQKHFIHNGIWKIIYTENNRRKIEYRNSKLSDLGL